MLCGVAGKFYMRILERDNILVIFEL